ncbi:MAG: glycosyl transferase family 51, partial [Deltaproteobacteria bacterium]
MRKTHRSVPAKKQKTNGKLKVIILLLLIIGGISGFAGWEMRTSRLQAMFFTKIAKTFSFEVKPNENKDIRFPVQGPYDIRLGYVRIQEWIEQLKNKGFVVKDQARWSYELEHCAALGLSPVYAEKNQAGIRILDKDDQDIINTAFPQRIYSDFESIPPIAVKLLLFIENRKLLDDTTPFRNPAIEWERLGKAVIDAGINVFIPGHRVPGGSTLATQMEKFRHSPEGITDSAEEKLRQLLSASLRAYLHGEQTGPVRKQIVLDYINSIPLSAAAGFGEVNGLGDGLWAWYGMDFDTVNRLLMDIEKKKLTPAQLNEAGAALKSVLSLFLAQRRPTAYLAKNRTALM